MLKAQETQMNRQRAAGTLNDRINGERSGAAEWQRRTKPNNSFNPTRLSVAFINVGCWDLCCVVMSAVGLIRALDAYFILKVKIAWHNFSNTGNRLK